MENVVYYSLVVTSEFATYLRQWVRSIASLRRFNKSTPVYLFLFNEPPQAILDKADRYGVEVRLLGSYRDCLRELAGKEGAALSRMPTLHKLFPLGHFGDAVSQVLYLDCDTFFFGDVAALFGKYQEHHWYAREELQSKRSQFPFRYEPLHINEDILYQIEAKAGAVPIPPYNSGIFMLNRGLSSQLFAMRKEYLAYAWQLTLRASMMPEISLASGMKKSIEDLRAARIGKWIDYPSNDYWILDQIALSLTLGKIPDLSHGLFCVPDVLQNGEFLIYRSYETKCTVFHYFSKNEALFFKEADGDQVC